jgi:hypothetical protein
MTIKDSSEFHHFLSNVALYFSDAFKSLAVIEQESLLTKKGLLSLD